LHGVQGVGSSSLLAPTNENEPLTMLITSKWFSHFHTICIQLILIRPPKEYIIYLLTFKLLLLLSMIEIKHFE